MKASDIITQLLRVLPSKTGLFSEEVSISSLSKAGTITTAVTAAAHGLTTGDYVYVAGANRKTPITSILRAGTVATVITTSDHDLTEGWITTVEITGAAESAYNGVKPLTNVNSRNKFTYTVTGAPTTPATGTPFLLEPWRRGFNGWYSITVTDSTTFTYTSEDSYTATASGTMVLRKLPRISGALNIDRAIDSYTKFGQNKLWAFVVLGDVTASRDKNTLSDAVALHTTGSAFRQNIINDVSIFIFYPMKDTISGRAERDSITDIATYLYKSVLGKSYSSYFTDDPTATLNFLSHKVLMWTTGYYIHQFKFEAVSELTGNDIIDPNYTRAFRDLELAFNNVDYGIEIVNTNINLDEDV